MWWTILALSLVSTLTTLWLCTQQVLYLFDGRLALDIIGYGQGFHGPFDYCADDQYQSHFASK